MGAPRMKGKKVKVKAAPGPTSRATWTALPQEVLEMIVNHVHGNDKIHLALCCKATLPILSMGHVRVGIDEHGRDEHERERPLLQAARCLTKQPSDVSHLEVWSRSVSDCGMHCCVASAHHLVDLSLLSSLRRLTLGRVKVSLPALQPIATRLHELNIHGSRLQGSAEGFLTKGWTALTSLALTNTRMEDATLSAALELPAVEGVDICWFEGHQGGELQIDQLIGSCPQISRLEFQLLWSQRLRQASRQSCTLVDFKRLVNLNIMSCSVQTNMDLDLPLSLTQLQFGGYMGGGTGSVDFFWALQEAVKCVRRGAQLHKLICHRTEAYLQPAQWGASLEDQHRRLGCQLSGLRELQVMGAQKELLSALGAVASAAPCLIRLEIETRDWDQKSNLRVNVSPICSATLESIRVTNCRSVRPDLPAPQVLLTLLPGCTRLQEVVVHFMGGPVEGAAVKIRCHSCSPRCTMPVVGHADDDHKVPEEVSAGAYNDVVVNFVRVACSEEGVRECTVLYACHAAGPEQAPLWGHAVMPGIL